MATLAIIALKYMEPEWQQTKECLDKVIYPVFYADRDGVGNMSRAFNDAYKKHVQGRFDFVWLVTNITFDPSVPERLLALASKHGADALHPAMASSDHVHLHPRKSDSEIFSVPFVELTAPVFKCSTFEKYYLCEATPYYYMDLIISYSIKQIGGYLFMANKITVGHTYLRNSGSVHPISTIRSQLRNYFTPISAQYMKETYGADWKKKLWHGAP